MLVRIGSKGFHCSEEPGEKDLGKKMSLCSQEPVWKGQPACSLVSLTGIKMLSPLLLHLTHPTGVSRNPSASKG